MACNECDEVVTCGGCQGTKTSCKCNIYEGTTLENTGITAGDSACSAYAKIDEKLLEIITNLSECCDDNNITEVGRGAAVPTVEPGEGEPVIYVRNNGEVYTWDGTEWILQVQVFEVEKGTGAPTSTPADDEPFIYINQLGVAYFWDKTNEEWILNINPINTTSGIKGDGSSSNPIKENFDNLPSESSIDPADYVVVSTSANPDGAKVPASVFAGSTSGITVEVDATEFLEAASEGLVLSADPTGTPSSTITFKLQVTNEAPEVLTGSTAGVGTSALYPAKVRLRWDKFVELMGSFELSSTGNLLDGSNLDILLTSLPSRMWPDKAHRFPCVFSAYENVGDPPCSFHASIWVYTNGQVRMQITDCLFVEAAETNGGLNGFNVGVVWLSGIGFYRV